MKLLSASIALLGLRTALAAILPAQNNAIPTRPDLAFGLPKPSPEPAALRSEDSEESRQEIAVPADDMREKETQHQHWWHDLLRRGAEQGGPTVHNTFTHLNTTSSKTHTTAAPTGTEIAPFTADGAIFTVTEISGVAGVDGKSLTPGGPAQLIGGEYISELSTGVVIVNGQTLSFTPYSSSSMAPSQQPATSAAAASSSAAAAASSKSSGAAAMHTGNVVAAVGAVIGAMVL